MKPTNKNILFYFKNLIEFTEKFDNAESQKQIYNVLNFIANSNKSIFKERVEYTSVLCDIIIKETGGGILTLISGIIYSFYRKDEIEINHIEDNFGSSISRIIEGLYKIPNLKTEKIDKQADKFIKLLLTITDDVRAILIILAKELYKIRNIDNYEKSERDLILNQSKTLYTPLAHQIGLYNIKTEFEEKTMKYAQEDMYRFIAKKLKETKASRDLYISDFISPLKNVLKKSGYTFTIKGRPKSIHSIWNKMKSQNVSFEEVYDLFAIRIILKSDIKNEKAVCWNVYSIITDLYKPNPKRLRDWISAPKLSGYESLHTTVLGADNKWVEVQIRTERMDEVAEKGPAAHWRYKSGKEGGSSNWLANIREAIENPLKFDEKEEKNSKKELYSDEILVFTPEGDLKALKSNYTVLDFAFSVHTKIGETCTGSVVNGKIQPLSYILQNGDIVKILTNKNKKPNVAWLEIAKSPRTKNKIKRALKAIKYNRADTGKDLIKEKLERLKIDFTEKNIAQLSEYFKFKSTVEFYNSVGEGIIDISKIKQAFGKKEEEIEEKAVISIQKSIAIEEITSDDFLLIDDNISKLEYSLAKCCNPIPGDDIFGFITVSKGTRIHKNSCPNSKDMKNRFPYRVVKAKWNLKSIGNSFPVNIFISGTDSAGLTSKISDIVTKEFNLKLKGVNLKVINNTSFEGIIIVNVNSNKQLNDLIKRIKMLKGISDVYQKSIN